MWCSSATIPILAVVIVSGVCYRGSSSSAFSTSASERVAAQSFHLEGHVAVVAVVSVIAVVAVSTHARAIAPSTCRVLDACPCRPRLFAG
ncbi:hypothetical protein EAG_14743 [Camponotus floridanus]|uniref:Uncharacterized protein n=1 Tax=Camponotus floridanus TaxID=104421 RepID=E2A977_CAMFO|nr:hypothetical protein EAG_14743 [Camponotus floridanus]